MFKNFKPDLNFLGSILSVFFARNVLGDLLTFSLLGMTVFFSLIPSRKIKKFLGYSIALASIAYIRVKFRSIFSVESAISFLGILQLAKYLTAFKDRDKKSHLGIVILFLIGQVIYDQDIFSVLGVFFNFLIILIGLFHVQNKNLTTLDFFSSFHGKVNWRSLFVIVFIMTAGFLFFPRVKISFNNIKKMSSKVGFSDNAKPGQSNEINFDNSKAFKVIFKNNKIPRPENMYWVGATLYKTNGYHWFPQKISFKRSKIKVEKDLYEYQVITSGLVSEYLFHLNYPVEKPNGKISYSENSPFTYKLNKQTTQKLNYFSKSSMSNNQQEEVGDISKKALEVPGFLYSSQVYELATKLKKPRVEDSLRSILTFFQKEDFYYTLRPGKTNSLKEFLFISKKGFCSHYASAFSILARLMNIPSRVVVGYQGGTVNPFDQVVTIYEKDSHAWSEVYIDGRGWVKFDPVLFIAKERILLGGQRFFSLSEKARNDLSSNSFNSKRGVFFKIKMGFEYLDNKWTKFMYSYNEDSQRKYFEKFKLRKESIFYFFSLFLILIFILAYYFFVPRKKKIDDPFLREYMKSLDFLRKKGVHKKPSDGPDTMIEKVKNFEGKIKKEKIIKVIKEYKKSKYRNFS